MSVEKSLEAFKFEKLNCAQSVQRGFQELLDISEENIKKFKKLGGGRAENGICGALYSALELTENESVKQNLREAFLEAAGSEKCREIRKKGKLSCAECVELAASILAKEV